MSQQNIKMYQKGVNPNKGYIYANYMECIKIKTSYKLTQRTIKIPVKITEESLLQGINYFH